MNGGNVPLLFLLTITVLVTVSVVMVSELPLWGAFLPGAIVALASLFSKEKRLLKTHSNKEKNFQFF